jgi:hypothetical protein
MRMRRSGLLASFFALTGGRLAAAAIAWAEQEREAFDQPPALWDE